MLVGVPTAEQRNVREALDQAELADDLAALVLDVLLRLLELRVRGVFGEGDLGRSVTCVHNPGVLCWLTLNWGILVEKEEGKMVDLLVVRLICRKHGHEVIKSSLYTWYQQ